MKIAKIIANIVTGAYLVLHSPSAAKAANINSEVTATKDYSLLDTKISGTLSKRFNTYLRNIATVNHETQSVNNFTLGDLIFPLRKGFDLITEVQLPAGAKADFRPGFQYFKSFGDALIGMLATRNFVSNPNTELLVVASFTPKITSKTKLLVSLESALNIGDRGYNFDNNKLRAGLKHGPLSGGVAAEIGGLGSNTNTQIGIFVASDI